jgi:hypothetical protein
VIHVWDANTKQSAVPITMHVQLISAAKKREDAIT